MKACQETDQNKPISKQVKRQQENGITHERKPHIRVRKTQKLCNRAQVRIRNKRKHNFGMETELKGR